MTPPIPEAASGPWAWWPGLLLAAGVAWPAWALGKAFPLLGGAVLAILLGIGLRWVWQPTSRCRPGLNFTSKTVLQLSIILMGFGLDLGQVSQVGMASLEVTCITLLLAFLAAWGLGRLLRVPATLAALVGVGTAICGASAIAAVAPILRADEHDTAFALSTIFLFNVAAVLVFPPLGHLLGMSDTQFGLWAGTAINDTSSVVAAGYAYSHAAGDYATIVKLTRASLILPTCLLLAGVMARQAGRRNAANGQPSTGLGKVMPWFIVGFVLAAALRSSGWLPAPLLNSLHTAGGLAMVLALAAIGLSADLQQMRATGARPILLGLGVWASVAVGSLLLQAL